LGEELLTPTLIYVRALELLQGLPIKAAAHITGGGLLENVPRVLPEGTAVKLHGEAWVVPPISNSFNNWAMWTWWKCIALSTWALAWFSLFLRSVPMTA